MKLRMWCGIAAVAGSLVAATAAAEYAGEIAIPLSSEEGAQLGTQSGDPDAAASRIYLGTRYDDALGRARIEAGVATRPNVNLKSSAGDMRLGLHCDLDQDEHCRGYGASLSYGRLGFSVDPRGFGSEGASARIMWRSTLGF